jgi:hypothetical protein
MGLDALSKGVAVGLACACYLLAISGVLFDIIRGPASLGETHDAGAVTYHAFVKYSNGAQCVYFFFFFFFFFDLIEFSLCASLF